MENQDFDIHKAGAIIIQDRKVLLTRTRGKDVFVNPGGKLMEEETVEQALVRELREELGISVATEDWKFFGTYFAKAAYDLTKNLRMDVFLIKSWRGDISMNREIEELLWVNSDLPDGIKLGSIFQEEVLPKLKAMDLID